MSVGGGPRRQTGGVEGALAALEEAGSTSKTASTTKAKKAAGPIGVDENFSIYRTDQTIPVIVDTGTDEGAQTADLGYNVYPSYFDGDEWMFITEGWGAEQIANIQLALVAAGLLDRDLADGAWMDESANAFKKVLGHANRMGVSWDQALMELANGRSAARQGPKGPTRAPFAARLSNPEDLKKVFQQTAYNLLGGKGFVDEEQVNQMVSAYHQIESSAQRGAYNAAASGGTVTEAPGPDTFAEGELETLDPDGVKAGRMASYVGVLEGMLRSGGG